MTETAKDFDRGFDAGWKAREENGPKAQQDGNGVKPIRNLSDVHKLSRTEVNDRWDEVQTVLGGQS